MGDKGGQPETLILLQGDPDGPLFNLSCFAFRFSVDFYRKSGIIFYLYLDNLHTLIAAIFFG